MSGDIERVHSGLSFGFKKIHENILKKKTILQNINANITPGIG